MTPSSAENTGWTEPARWPALAGDYVHVWLAHLPSARATSDALTKLLSPAEAERASRFHFDAHRERWQLTRGILRTVLGRCLEVAPREITFSQNEHGKPALVEGGLNFNLSHSGDYAAFAVTRLGPVGVDIEEIRAEMKDCDEIARRYFAPGEQKHLAALEAGKSRGAFFDCWTRKEAFVKAQGDGVFSGLDRFEVSLDEPRLLRVDGGAAEEFSLLILPPIEGYAGAAVVRARQATPRFFRWDARFVA